jgi:DNA-binding winged helix-turn-helix (wHTH) protein
VRRSERPHDPVTFFIGTLVALTHFPATLSRLFSRDLLKLRACGERGLDGKLTDSSHCVDMPDKPDMPRPEDVLIEALMQAAAHTAHAVYEFDEFRLEIAEGRLLRRGERVPMAPKEFETLRVLVEHHGRLVSKQMLLEHVWPGTYVGDDTIAQRVSLVRKALGEETSASKYIETVPKRGYRFIACVRML